MERGVVIGGGLVAVSFLLAVAFNSAASRERATRLTAEGALNVQSSICEPQRCNESAEAIDRESAVPPQPVGVRHNPD